ncbi:hypothetical protein [Actinomadura sp. 3N508]|uniref:hypothetical protein n=1 Tax=Actinomadura sp. 3N508 TaxID=3375153 RepID=UPI0037B84284
MQFDVETPLAGYNGTVGAVTFAAGRARVDGDRKAELGYFRRHGYRITPVAEPTDAGEPGGPAPADPAAEPPEPTETPQAKDEPPGPPGPAGPGGESEPTVAEGAAQPDSEQPDPTGTGNGTGEDPAPSSTASQDTPTVGGSEGGTGEQLRRPPKNAPVAAWTAYARQLGLTDSELGGKTKNELVELVAQHEKREAGK